MSSEFARFLIVGVINTGSGYVLYLLFLLVLPYTMAYSTSYVMGIFISYYLNARFVFRRPLQLRQALQFPLVYLVQYLLGVTLLYGLVTWIGIDKRIGPILVVIVTIPVTFLLSRLIISRRVFDTPSTS